MSGGQLDAYSSLRSYLGAEGDGSSLGTMGPLMCTLSLLVWTITIAHEVNSAHAFSSALLTMTRRGATATALDGDGCLIVKSVSPQRCGCLLAVQLVRLATAGLLLIYGCVQHASLVRACLVCLHTVNYLRLPIPQLVVPGVHRVGARPHAQRRGAGSGDILRGHLRLERLLRTPDRVWCFGTCCAAGPD
eukprot:2862762-Prymnesium_polylepis.3